MEEKTIKINKNTLKTLIDTLELVKDERRLDLINELFINIEQVLEETQQYAELNKVDFKIALEKVIEEKELSLGIYCKYGC